MNRVKFLTVFFTLFLLISATNVFALSYRTDVDNGSWSQYNAGLGSAFYQASTTGQTTYNRSFEGDAFSVTATQCSDFWCVSGSDGTVARSSDFAQDGTQSLKFTWLAGDVTAGNAFSKTELVGDSNISFYIKGTLGFNTYFGYVDDANTFTNLLTVANGAVLDWNYLTVKIPAGKYRFAISGANGGNPSTFYVDNVRVLRNNVGTFRTTDPQYCGSIGSCSNIEYHLPANQLGTLYWTVDFVAGASCTWSKGGVGQGAMTEGANGMYYANVNTAVDVNDWKDVTLSATCSKVPYSDKSFYTIPRLYKYGNIAGGNFESETISFTNALDCSTNWCSIGANKTTTTTGLTAQDAENSLKIVLDGLSGALGTIYSRTQTNGGAQISFYFKGSPADGFFNAGYVNDANAFTGVIAIKASILDWNYYTYAIPSGSYRVAFGSTDLENPITMYIDNISSSAVKQDSTMTTANTLSSGFGLKGTTYSFYSTYLTGAGSSITDANCYLVVDDTYNLMTYSSGNSRYEYSQGFTTDGAYTIKHTCGSVSYNDGNSSYTATIATPASQIINFTPIQNISAYNLSNFSPLVDFSITNDTTDIIFSVVNEESAYSIDFTWTNTTDGAGKQYSVYTSSDGVNWVFNDSLTFGVSTSYNDPVQKIAGHNLHYYSFGATLPNAVKVYYKLVLNTLPLAWQTIANSTDWVNVNQPTIYTDTNGYNWDLFADSNYTPIRSYTSKRFPDMTTADLNAGFELQFTAYAEASTTLKIGYTINGSDTTLTVPITTTPTRFSVPVDPSSNEARLLIDSDGNNTNIYMTDYAVVPKAYFTGRLEIFNDDGSPLQAIMNEGSSKVYIREAIPYTIKTSAYDRDADLKMLKVEASIDGITIKTKDFLLTDATSKDHVFTWDELIDGFVDLDGTALLPVGMRNIYIKVTLYNMANQSVAEQSTTVKILQYPYFESDISFSIYSLNAKVGENPAVRLNLNQKDPTQLIGVKFYIYDINHSLADPNYSETVLNDVLGCTSFICSKDLTINSYVFEADGQYKIAVQLLLKTETESLTNPLTLKIFNQQVTYREFETARILQVFERTDHTYRNDEPIQLVLQLRDIPYKNLSGDTSVYITADLCTTDSGATCGTFGTTKFYPKKFIYDETTGYNYYFFDQLFYTDGGALLPDGNYIRFQANISDKLNTHKIVDLPTATLADKCASASYGTLFNDGWFNMNFWDSLIDATERALFGCGTLTSAIVNKDDAEEKRVLIDADHNVTGGQNESIACLKIDNANFQNSLEQDLVCGVIWNKNQQSIDKFVFTIGNENSDYSKSGSSAQYLTFQVPAEQLIFSDSFMLQQALNSEYGTDTIDTIGEMFFYGFDKLFSGVANPLTNVLEGTTKTGLITNMGFDMNWDNQLNPTYVKGIFFFKVKGLKVVNQYDYINQFPELEHTNPQYFREFANQKKLKLPIQNTFVNVYSNDLTNWSLVGDQLDSLEVVSPLVIYAKPTYAQTGVDQNVKTVATTLKFNLTADMISNNSTAVQRVFLPLTFSYIVPQNLSLGGFLNDVLYGRDSAGNPAGLFTNPVGFGFKNWFWFLLGVIGILILSLIVRNFRTRGTTVNVSKGR